MTVIDEARLTEEQAHERTDAFVSRMNLSARVIWLQHQYVTDIEILDALLNKEDPALDRFTEDLAHEIASAWVNGNLERPPVWLG